MFANVFVFTQMNGPDAFSDTDEIANIAGTFKYLTTEKWN